MFLIALARTDWQAGTLTSGGTECERQIRWDSNLVHGMCTRSALCISRGIGAKPADENSEIGMA